MNFGSEATVALTVSSVVLVGANPGRYGLLVSSPKTNSVTISQNKPAVAGTGITLRPGTDTMFFSTDNAGDWVQKELNAVCDAGTESIGVIEVLCV